MYIHAQIDIYMCDTGQVYMLYFLIHTKMYPIAPRYHTYLYTRGLRLHTAKEKIGEIVSSSDAAVVDRWDGMGWREGGGVSV